MTIISVSGSSGVGKTTLTKLIESVIGSNNTVCLSGDDLHRWERNDSIWDTHTHLDPNSNDLDMGYSQILSLKRGESISRRFYNHDTGKFDLPTTITPKPFLIYEGLHALYHDATTKISDILIFVDTDDALKTEWKIKRDTKKRGYTEAQVMNTMLRRKRDEDMYITPQRDRADIVVKFTKNRDGAISLEFINITGRGWDIMSKVKDFYDSMNDFMEVCRWLSLDPSLVQGRGGNVSIKCKSGLIVKASGSKMADVNLHHGFCVCAMSGHLPTFNTETEYMDYIQSSKKVGTHRPSMETGFHMSMGDRVIIHTHPIHLNALLCSKESRAIIKGLFQDLSCEYIEYTMPGMNLVNRLREHDNTGRVVFLENHGLIVGGETTDEAMRLTEYINNKCKKWLGNHAESFVDLDEDATTTNSPLFPDAAVFPSEMATTNNYILRLMTSACLTPRFLGENDIESLSEMDSEKYRKAIP